MSSFKPLRTARVLLNRCRGEAVVDGIRLPIDRAILSPNMERTLAKGRYEWGEARLGARVISPGNTVLELGAGIGYVSSYIRCNTGAGKIVCVEANPALVPYIANVHRINRIAEATVLNGIVQSAPGDSLIPFYCRRDFWESSLTAESGPYTHIVDVPSLRFADVLEEHKPNVLIMDIEGGELPLLLGLKQMSHVRAIVAEIHENVYGEGGLGQLIAAVARLGFVEDASGAARAVRTWVRTSH